MKKIILATIFAAVVASPALAGQEYTLVKDTVGNCSAVASSSAYPGMKIMSTQSYSSMDSANKALGDLKGCSGLVR